MNLQEIDSLRALLPSGRTLFPYFKDKYALQLLGYALPRPTPVAELRQHPAAQLLQKPLVRSVLAQCGGTLDRSRLYPLEPTAPEQHYTLSLDVWGEDGKGTPQTSRGGANLVLQLNFSHAHNRALQSLLKPVEGLDPFNFRGHPALRDPRRERRYTLAWARLDIDFEQGEALIEEIQTDWLRTAARIRRLAASWGEVPFTRRYGSRFAGGREAFIRYHDEVLLPHAAHWDEAMLAATLFFLREELGLPAIWMHSARSGALLKNIRGSLPPQSLYTSLPQRFCFRAAPGLPGFLQSVRQVRKRLRQADNVQLLRFTL